MFNKILVLISDILHSQSAVAQAAALSKAFSADVNLLGMMKPDVSRFADPILHHTTKSHKLEDFGRLVSQLKAENVSAQLTFLDTFVIEKFVRYLNDHEFDFIVISEKDHMIRTLMRDALAHTSVPMLFASKRFSKPIRRILLPLDFSRRAECVLPLATVMARSMDATLVLAHIMEKAERSDRGGENHQEGIRYLSDLSLRLPNPTKIINVAHSNVALGLHEIIKREEIDLVTLSAHGSSGQPDRCVGSITNNLMDYSPTSLLVLQDLPSELSSSSGMRPTLWGLLKKSALDSAAQATRR